MSAETGLPDLLQLDEPLTEAELAHIVKWYEAEVSDPRHAATHDCHVVRAFRELLRLKANRPERLPRLEFNEFCGQCKRNKITFDFFQLPPVLPAEPKEGSYEPVE